MAYAEAKVAASKNSQASVSPYGIKSDPYSSHSIILAQLGEGRGQLLLDVGAASGYLAERLTRQGWEVTCLERDPQLAAEASQKCRAVILADLDECRLELDGLFDTILYADILEHLREPARVVKSLNRYLKPGGLVVISVPNVAHLWIRLQLLWGRFEYRDRGILDRTHLRFFTLATLRHFLDDVGLKPAHLTVTPVPLPLVIPDRYQGKLFALCHAVNALLARIWRTMFAYQFVVFAHLKTDP